ncbi:MAG: hypothetical protein MR902_08615 [Campylobacter sp.]|nr:hypothetical protein [Campylobacter sp.]
MDYKEIKRIRSYYYEFFALPFLFSEDDEIFNRWQDQLNFLYSASLSKDNESAFKELSEFKFDEFKSEQNAVFFDFSFANVPLGASFYTEGRDEGHAKHIITDIIKKTDFRLNENSHDSEDSIYFVLLSMSKMLSKNEAKYTLLSSQLFTSIINEIIDEFIYLLKYHKSAKFFKNLAILFENFISLERSVYGLSKPPLKDIARQSLAKKPYETKMENIDEIYDILDKTEEKS